MSYDTCKRELAFVGAKHKTSGDDDCEHFQPGNREERESRKSINAENGVNNYQNELVNSDSYWAPVIHNTR